MHVNEYYSLRNKKVMTMGVVTEMTGLSVRKIRYYEQRELIFPERTPTGIRKYSFSDIEKLMEIARKIEDGVQTAEIRIGIKRRENWDEYKKNMIKDHE
jgi:MerR family transcriptional regulator, global nitrogen regulator